MRADCRGSALILIVARHFYAAIVELLGYDLDNLHSERRTACDFDSAGIEDGDVESTAVVRIAEVTLITDRIVPGVAE